MTRPGLDQPVGAAAINSVPRRMIAEQVRRAMDGAGYVTADESTRTSIPGVFAVGDVRTKAVRQIVTAAADGAVAAHYAEEYLLSLAEREGSA